MLLIPRPMNIYETMCTRSVSSRSVHGNDLAGAKIFVCRSSKVMNPVVLVVGSINKQQYYKFSHTATCLQVPV